MSWCSPTCSMSSHFCLHWCPLCHFSLQYQHKTFVVRSFNTYYVAFGGCIAICRVRRSAHFRWAIASSFMWAKILLIKLFFLQPCKGNDVVIVRDLYTFTSHWMFDRRFSINVPISCCSVQFLARLERHSKRSWYSKTVVFCWIFANSPSAFSNSEGQTAQGLQQIPLM